MSPQTVTFKVDDMHCDSCPKLIKMDLEDRPGVTNVDASLDTKLVSVVYDPAQSSVTDLVNIIKSSGYTAIIQS